VGLHDARVSTPNSILDQQKSPLPLGFRKLSKIIYFQKQEKTKEKRLKYFDNIREQSKPVESFGITIAVVVGGQARLLFESTG
jgi:hypothetical protein